MCVGRRSRLLPVVLLCLIPLEVACGDSRSQPVATPSSLVTTESTGDGTPLQPVVGLRSLGENGTLPARPVITFDRPVFRSGDVGCVAGGQTALRTSPEIPGELRVASTSELELVPRGDLDPATRYSLELDAIQVGDSVLRPSDSGPWRLSFATPEFRFLRMSQQKVDRQRHKLELALQFSAPVEVTALRNLASLRVDGAATAAEFEARPPNAVIASLPLPDASKPHAVTLEFKAGVPLSGGGGVTAPAVTATLPLATGKRAQILEAVPREGPSGFSVDVLCSDGAAGTDSYRWVQSWGRYVTTSPRCVPDEESARTAIHLTPPVAFTLVASTGGFRLLGDFRQGTYALRVDGGMRSADGGVFEDAYEGSLAVPALAPQLSFVAQGRYLPREAWHRLAIHHRNVAAASIEVRQVPQQSLVFWMSEPTEQAGERVADVIAQTTVELTSPPDAFATSWLDVAALAPATTRGLLEITIRGEGTSDTRRLLLTDMNLVVKRAARPAGSPWPEEMHVWALGIESTLPLEGVDVDLIRKSGSPIASCRTTSDGGCVLAASRPGPDLGLPFALVARSGQDLTYLKLGELQIQPGDAAVAGESYRSQQAYRAALYSDRGVYRPGEKVHLVGIVRDRENLAPPEAMPVVAVLSDPRARELKRVVLQTNAAGMVSLDVPLEDFAPTGSYRLTVSAGERQISAYSFQVEEFVPERMKVEVSFARSEYLAADPAEGTVKASYLFGGVPTKHAVELTCELQPAAFTPAENAQLHYGLWASDDEPPRPQLLSRSTAVLDGTGRADVSCQSQGASTLEGPVRLVASAAVLEAGSGRTTVGKASVAVHPERYYLGLADRDGKVQAGKELTVEGAVVDWNGKLINDPVQVTIELHRLDQEYTWFYDDRTGASSYRTLTRPVLDGSTTVSAAGGKFSARLTPAQDASGFLVRARAGRTRTDLRLAGIGGYWAWQPAESQTGRTPSPQRPAWLVVSGPSAIRIGEAAEVQLTVPYRGRLLLAVETDHLLSSEWRAVEPGPVKWSFRVDAAVPNVYVSAFLVKNPHLESANAFLPDRAFGVRSLPVQPEAYTQEVSLTVPERVRSSSRLNVRLDLPPGDRSRFATVAVVDEGVLSLTGFATPNPLPTLFPQRRLEVETLETVGWDLTLPAQGEPAEGGDGRESTPLPGRVQPVKPVALWSGVVAVPENGTLDLGFDLPLYRGNLRVMAVTAGAQRVGRANANVVVSDPIAVQATLPRFLSGGDEVQIPVFVTNLSGARQHVKVRLEARGLPVPGVATVLDEVPPLEMEGEPERLLELADGESGTVVYRALANRQVGAARVRVLASAGDVEVLDEAQVPFLPAGPRERTLTKVKLRPGETDLKPFLTGWVPTTERSTFWVTGNPYGDAFDHLQYLRRYPFG